MTRTPPKKPMDVEPLTRSEVHALLATFSNAPTGVRNRALVTVFWRSGLRCAEALALLLRDVNVERRTVHVRDGKGGKSRVVPIDAEALTVVQLWLLARRQMGVKTHALFCSHKGAKLLPSYVRTMLTRHGARAEIQKRVHAHGLRHTYAQELDGERVPMSRISELLGHSSVATTSLYIQNMGSQDLADVVAARPKWQRRK